MIKDLKLTAQDLKYLKLTNMKQKLASTASSAGRASRSARRAWTFPP